MIGITPTQYAERKCAQQAARPVKVKPPRVCKNCGRDEQQTYFAPKARRCAECLEQRKIEKNRRYVQRRNIRRRETGRR
jgi:predicted Zn-ribbon and HTH transcriptional regulator